MILPVFSDSNNPPCSWLDTIQVQRFDDLYDARPSATLALGDALDAILWGRYAAAITRLRQRYVQHGEDAYASAKRRLPQYTFAGTFQPTRARDHLQQHSSVVHADLDHLRDLTETKLTLIQDPHTVYIFTSPRGDGLKYGVRIAPVDSDTAYRHAWQRVADMHRERYGVTWDPSGKDICRLCFVSWDPTCFLNPDAAVVVVPPPPPPAPPPGMPPRHWPSPRLQTAADRALAYAERLIIAAPEGSRHAARLKASYLIGGFVASTELSYAEALDRLTAAALTNTTQEQRARHDIVDGLMAGQQKPITAAHHHRRAEHWISRACTAKEDASWQQ